MSFDEDSISKNCKTVNNYNSLIYSTKKTLAGYNELIRANPKSQFLRTSSVNSIRHDGKNVKQKEAESTPAGELPNRLSCHAQRLCFPDNLWKPSIHSPDTWTRQGLAEYTKVSSD